MKFILVFNLISKYVIVETFISIQIKRISPLTVSVNLVTSPVNIPKTIPIDNPPKLTEKKAANPSPICTRN